METNFKTMNSSDEEFFSRLRADEYPILDRLNHVYLDYTGGNLCPAGLINRLNRLLSENILGNPHSENPASVKSTQLIEETRQAVLDFFNAGDYECIFTANASSALKIVGESYPFNEASTFILTSDNHNSVNGIREFCKSGKGSVKYAPIHYEDLKLDSEGLEQLFASAPAGDGNLFAFPAQSNVSGVKHDLKWIEYAHEKGFDVLLDAAAFVPTSKLDLQMHKPDFVCISFYKIFGYPTGIGCLLVRKSAFGKLKKPWFAGGTVTLVSVVEQNRFLAPGHERFEDGTPDYMNIPCVKYGLDYISSIGYDRISARVAYLVKYLFSALSGIKHSNGRDLLKISGPDCSSERGGNVIMNFFDVHGNGIAYSEVEHLANSRNISIRSGCFCNPGIDEINNCITNDEMARYFSSRERGDYNDMVAALGKMRGAIRVSVGIASNTADVDRFVKFVNSLADYDLNGK